MCGALHPVYPNDLPHSSVQLKIDRSGRVTIFTGTSDIGQGSNQMLVTLCAERLGIPPELCTVIEADSDLCPVDLGSYSSRVTFMAGNAMLDAADKIRAQTMPFWLKMGLLRNRHQSLQRHLPSRGSNSHMDRSHLGGRAAVWRTGFNRLIPRQTPTVPEQGGCQSDPLRPILSQHRFAELTVDPDTGFITVHDIWCAHDLGRTLHPEIADGQIEGCVYMGVGEALFEEQAYRGPIMMTPSILEYKIPTVTDTPRFTPFASSPMTPMVRLGQKKSVKAHSYQQFP